MIAANTITLIADNAGTHTFTSNSTGGGLANNNIQPTLFIGNVFIYSGLPAQGSYPGIVGINPQLI